MKRITFLILGLTLSSLWLLPAQTCKANKSCRANSASCTSMSSYADLLEETGLSRGLLIRETKAEGPAALAGLEAGDLITGIDQYPIDNLQEFRAVLANYQPGEQVQIHTLRKNEDRSTLVQLGTKNRACGKHKSKAYLGVYLRNVGQQHSCSSSSKSCRPMALKTN